MPRTERTRLYRDTRTHTRCLVGFFSDRRNGLSTDGPVASAPGLGKIIGVTTDKQLGSASGTFNITVKKDPRLYAGRSALRLWRDPEDVWVKIVFVVDGQPIDTMLGLVDSMKEVTVRDAGGQRTEGYTISGRDFGKVFETTELFVNFHHAPERPLQSVTELTATGLVEAANTPEGFIRALLDLWLGNNGAAEQQWILPEGLGGGFFSSSLKKQIQAMDRLTNGEAFSPSLFQLDQTGGKLWDVMQEYSNGLMNELFVDLGPNGPVYGPQTLANLKPVLYLRERPFPTYDARSGRTNTRKWDQLRRRVLPPGSVKERHIAKGGAAHRFNYWQIMLEGIGTEGFNVDEILQRGVEGVEPGFPGNIPIWSTESIQKHGLRRYKASTRFIPPSASEQANFYQLAGEWLKKLHDWYVVAPYELTGTLRCSRVFPEIRIGERVEERRVGETIHYYVEGVSHSWSYPGAGATTLTVTRGEVEGDELLEYAYEQYETPSALSARERCFIPEDADIDESLDLLAEGCGFAVVEGDETGFTLEDATVGEGAGYGPEDPASAQSNRQRALASETASGRTGSDEPTDPEMVPTIDDSIPEVGDAEAIPPPGETGAEPATPVLDQGRLERGEPIELEGLDDVATIGSDPLAGLEGS